MTDKERYAVQIALVKEECKDVDEDEVAKETMPFEGSPVRPTLGGYKYATKIRSSRCSFVMQRPHYSGRYG